MLSEASKFAELLPVFFDFSLKSKIPLEFLVVLCGVESDGRGGISYGSRPESGYSEQMVEKALRLNPEKAVSEVELDLSARAGPFMFSYFSALELGFEGTLDLLSSPWQNTRMVCEFFRDKEVPRGDFLKFLAVYRTGRPDGVLSEDYLMKVHKYLRFLKHY